MITLNIPLFCILDRNDFPNFRHLLPDLAPWLSGSYYPCLEQVFVVLKMFELLKFACSGFRWLDTPTFFLTALGKSFLMTDSICHSSLPRTVLEKVTLTTIQFRIHSRTKVDPMFQCVYISTPLKSCPYKVVQLVLDLWRESLRKPSLIYVRTTKAQISLRVRAGWSAPLLFAVARFFRRRSVSQT